MASIEDDDDLLTSSIDLSFMPNFDPLAPPKTLAAKRSKSITLILYSIVGLLIAIALILWAKSNGTTPGNTVGAIATSTFTATPPSPSSSPTPTPTPSVSHVNTPAPVLGTHEAPQGVVAQYTTSGIAIYWTPPKTTESLTGYKLEISADGSKWTVLSEVSPTKHSLTLTKRSSTGWTSFRVSGVYAQGQVVSAKSFGLPGTFS